VARLVLALHADPSASAPAQHRSLLAYHYAQAALVSGHQIDMVFFYSAGVLHAHSAQSAEVITLWQQLAEQHAIPLVICNTVAENDYNLASSALRVPFQAGGLTEFSMAAAAADHVVQF